MTQLPVYVCARDGAYYLNPVLLFDGGFVRFVSQAWTTEFVVWLEKVGATPTIDVERAVEKLFALPAWSPIPYGAAPKSLLYLRDEEVAVPGGVPPALMPARIYRLELRTRIPRPQLHEGSTRWIRNQAGHHVVRLPAHPTDAYALEIPG